MLAEVVPFVAIQPRAFYAGPSGGALTSRRTVGGKGCDPHANGAGKKKKGPRSAAPATPAGGSMDN